MSWEKIATKRALDLQGQVRVGLRTGCGVWRLHIYIGREISKKLGWNPENRVHIFTGTGKDEGWLRLERADRGEYKLRFSNRSVRDGSLWVSFQKTPRGLVERLIPSMTVPHIIEPGGALDVKLPEIFWRKYEKKRPDLNIGRPPGRNTVADPSRAADGMAVGGAAE